MQKNHITMPGSLVKSAWPAVLTALAGFLPAASLLAQPEISDPLIEMIGEKIHVSYKIENARRTDEFKVWMEVTDSLGNTIRAESLGGDVGDGIQGGSRKEIIWDLEADSIRMNADIYFRVYADPVETEKPPAGVPVKEEGSPVTASAAAGEYNRARIMLQSLVLPGLGLTRVTGKPHWIRGVAGYACIGGAVYLNRKAISTYGDYRTPSSADEAGTLLAQARRQDNISEALAYGAIGVWITDIIWTLARTRNPVREGMAGDGGDITLSSGLEPRYKVPLLTFRYTF